MGWWRWSDLGHGGSYLVLLLLLGVAFLINAAHSGARITYLRDPHEAVKGAQVIYTDTWTSMGQEEETPNREKVFPPYQVNAQLVSEADADVIVMHCLPAHRGEEISSELMDDDNTVIWEEAENRLHAQKAVLAMLLGGEGQS